MHPCYETAKELEGGLLIRDRALGGKKRVIVPEVRDRGLAEERGTGRKKR